MLHYFVTSYREQGNEPFKVVVSDAGEKWPHQTKPELPGKIDFQIRVNAENEREAIEKVLVRAVWRLEQLRGDIAIFLENDITALSNPDPFAGTIE